MITTTHPILRGVAAALALTVALGGALPAVSQTPTQEPDLPAPEPRHFDELPDLFKPEAPKDPDIEAIDLSAEVLETYVTFFPGRSTAIGVTTFQKAMGDYRRTSIAGFLGSYKGYLARIDKVSTATLTERGKLELEALRVHIRSVIREIETDGAPYKDPNFYVDESLGAIQALHDWDETNNLKRAEHMMARLSLFRYFYKVAQENLGVCTKPAVRRAIIRLRSSAPLLTRDLPDEFKNAGHPSASEAGPTVANAAWKDVAAFADWLEKTKLPTAVDPAPVGEKSWVDWLGTVEAVPMTSAQIMTAAQGDLTRLQAEFKKTAEAIAPGKPAGATFADLLAERQEPELARKNARGAIDELWLWVTHSKAVVPPSDDVILVRETPSFRRREEPIRAELPGTYSLPDATGFLEIAAPDPTWPPYVLAPWLSAYGKWTLPAALLREVYPGRFMAWQKTKLSKVRACRAMTYPTMSEGWPTYAEELALRSGYASKEPKQRLVILGDLIRADARLIGSVRLHAMGAPAPEITAYLVKEAYYPREEASIETARLIADLDRAAPGLGRLELLALLDDAKREKGEAFDSRAFHDRLLSYGPAPVSALRKVLFPTLAGPPLPAAK